MNYKELIEKKGMKKTFIAEQMGISRHFLYQCLSGKKKFTRQRKSDLHRLLGL